MKLMIEITDRTVVRDILTRNLEATSETDKVIIEALYNGTAIAGGCKGCNSHESCIECDIGKENESEVRDVRSES